MNWFTGLVDTAGQWLVEAPLVAQMPVLLLTVIPLCGVLAWLLHRAIDAVFGLFKLLMGKKG